MAFRIHHAVVRGEIDNRARGLVRGRIWLAGRDEPLVLELAGNACPDLAGCQLAFASQVQPAPNPQFDALQTIQRGPAGDITASRKVRVIDVPAFDAEPDPAVPDRVANCLYIEWFTRENGRVVIESPDFQMTITPPEWRMTPEEEAERADQAALAMADFLQGLNAAIEQHHRAQKPPDQPWDEHDYERFFKECDARTDKYAELLDKYGSSEDADALIDEAMGWNNSAEDWIFDDDDEGEDEEILEISAEDFDEPPPQPDPGREGTDWVRTRDGDLAHPLQQRCVDASARIHRRITELGLEDSSDDHLQQFMVELQVTGAKLAGALSGIARGEPAPEDAFTVAYLKRALNHLHNSQAALEATASKRLLPEALLAQARRELLEIRQAILNLMDKYRGRL